MNSEAVDTKDSVVSEEPTHVIDSDATDSEGGAMGVQHAVPSDAPDKLLEGQAAQAAPDTVDEPWSIWSSGQRKAIIVAASCGTLLSQLATMLYYPSLDRMARDLNVSEDLINLSITTFVIIQGIVPTFAAQLSDTAGRRPIYIACLTIFAAANVGLGAQNSFVALLILRGIQSAGGSGVSTLASAVTADITTSAERGTYVSFVSTIPMIGMTFGPLLGGVIAKYAGWHSVFWFLLALTCAVIIPMAVFFPETCRAVVGNGSIPPPSWSKCCSNARYELEAKKQSKALPNHKCDELVAARRIRFPNPFATVTLLLERECGFVLLYSSIMAMSFYATLAMIPSQFARTYGFDEIRVALCYIPFGIGSVGSAYLRGRMLDASFRRHAERLGMAVAAMKIRQTDLSGFPLERSRLEVAIPTIVLGSATIVGFGWMLQLGVHPAGPLVMLFVIGFCVSASLNCIAVLTLDIYPGKAGTVMAANNLLRCALGAGATAAIVPMINAIGLGWALVAFSSLNIAALPLLWYVMRQGPRWRADSLRKKLEQQAAAGAK